MRLYSVYYISVDSSTSFRCWCPSSVACTTVITASGSGQPSLLQSALIVELLSSWWWVSTPETCRAVYRYVINWIQSHLVGQLFNLKITLLYSDHQYVLATHALSTTVWTMWHLNSCIAAVRKCWQFAWSSFGSITKLFSAFHNCRIWCCHKGCCLPGSYCVAQQKCNDTSEQSTASFFRVVKQWLSVWKAYWKYLISVHIQCSALSDMWLMPAKRRIHTLLLVTCKQFHIFLKFDEWCWNTGPAHLW